MRRPRRRTLASYSAAWVRTGVLAVSLACSARPPSARAAGVSWPEADALFHQDPRWLGADAAYSVDLGGGRVAWLFGDSFIATSAANVRAESKMVRNSVAVQTGIDPTRARMSFAWGTSDATAPVSFFPEAGEVWHWPGGGIRFPGGSLVVFLAREHGSSGGLGFESAGWEAVRVDNPDDDPGAWRLRWLVPPPQAFDAVVGSAVAVDGDHVVALATRANGAHWVYLARFPAASLGAGDLSGLEWWTGAGWTPATQVDSPAAVFDLDSATEASFHFVSAIGSWLLVASRGFGASTIAIRTAPAVTGTWSDAADAFTPPESLGPHPFVYAGKAHPELGTPDGSLAVTYATNSFQFVDLLSADGQAKLYWPRFARLTLVPR